MGYAITCGKYRHTGWAINIVDLIDNHTDSSLDTAGGLIKCDGCGAAAGIFQESSLQERGEVWSRFIRGVIRLATDFRTYSPYVFLTSESKDGAVTGIHFNYYKDTRRDGGRLKHGHGPGGAPVLSQSEFLDLLEKLVISRAINLKAVKNRIRRLEGS